MLSCSKREEPWQSHNETKANSDGLRVSGRLLGCLRRLPSSCLLQRAWKALHSTQSLPLGSGQLHSEAAAVLGGLSIA